VKKLRELSQEIFFALAAETPPSAEKVDANRTIDRY